ncbi:MAG: hypothetical protein M1831_005538 [Alyxoria varia]|nr:MAG: hypothetical protein M1831_005538 [Alyxoria varia]
MASGIEDHSDPEGSPEPQPHELPDDLPKSLDDRRTTKYNQEVEVYDAWQGQAQVLTTSSTAKPLNFNLSLDDYGQDADLSIPSKGDTHGRFDKMLAAQAAHKSNSSAEGDEDQVASDTKMPASDKKEILQRSLNLSASNGDTDRLQRLLSGAVKDFVDLNAPDTDGTAPLIYASCFGHADVVSALLNAGADVDKKDHHSWTSLMWATANRHQDVVKLLLEHGASPEAKSSGGRTAFEFVDPNSDISDYLHENGYKIGNAGMTDDFYDSGVSQDRFEEEMAENEMKRRMMMESAINLEVDLGNLGLDEQPESPEEEAEEGHDFVWDRCLNDQMFVFQESELGRILDIIITNMTPQRTPSQKPVPANIMFLSARYAHYHGNQELLETLFDTALEKLNDVIDRHQWDMTMLAFWISNTTLLLHYLKKDAGVVEVTTEYQVQISEIINEIFVLIIRDAERRMDKVFDAALLDHETIPGFEDIHFQHEWNIFRSKSKAKPEPPEKRFRPPSPKRRAKVSPRNITSLLSSTLFVLDLYDIHSVITTQIIGQLLYWLGAEMFNRVMSNRKYLARTKAMQVRMNVSTIEEWARNNNRQPEHYEQGSMNASGEATMDAARVHLAPVIQLLQWLQILTSLGDNHESLEGTVKQLPRLSPQQLIHAVKYYRPEVGEKTLPKSEMKYLNGLHKDFETRKAKRRSGLPPDAQQKPNNQSVDQPETPTSTQEEEDEAPDDLLLDPALMLPFSLPTLNDMIISYGAGFGGVNRERARKYIPTVPPEFLAKLDVGGSKSGSVYDNASFNEE